MLNTSKGKPFRTRTEKGLNEVNRLKCSNGEVEATQSEKKKRVLFLLLPDKPI